MLTPVLLLATLLAEPSQCEALAKLALSSAEIASAQWMAAGPMPTSPASSGAAAAARAAQPPTMLPAHCRVAIVMRPSTDSEIEAEVWLPAEWNGKFQAVGKWGMGWHDQLSSDGGSAAGRLRARVYRHRAQRRQRCVCDWSSREADRVRLPRGWSAQDCVRQELAA